MPGGLLAEQGQRLNIELGSRIRLEFDGVDAPLNGLFVGMEVNQFIIIKMPPGTGLSNHLYEGKRVILKYVGAGKILGFRAKVLAYLFKKGLIVLFLSYPRSVESFDLRTSKRIDCYIPSSIKLNNQVFAGFVLDISTGGCRFGFREVLPELLDILQASKHAVLIMDVLGVEEIQQIGCSTKNMQKVGNSIAVGLKFEDISDSVKEKVETYVRNVLEYMQGL